MILSTIIEIERVKFGRGHAQLLNLSCGHLFVRLTKRYLEGDLFACPVCNHDLDVPEELAAVAYVQSIRN